MGDVTPRRRAASGLFVKIDTLFFWSPEWCGLSGTARAAFVEALSYIVEQESAGHIPKALLARYCPNRSRVPVVAAELTECGLWVEEDQGWFVPLFAEWHDTPESIAEAKAKDRLRKGVEKHRAHVFTNDGHRCVWCGSREDLQVDHIMPVSLGGGSERSNLQTLCGPCNRRKAARVHGSN